MIIDSDGDVRMLLYRSFVKRKKTDFFFSFS